MQSWERPANRPATDRDFTPYNPPWYPYPNNSRAIVSLMSNNLVRRYDAWTNGLPPGRLVELIREYRATGTIAFRDADYTLGPPPAP